MPPRPNVHPFQRQPSPSLYTDLYRRVKSSKLRLATKVVAREIIRLMSHFKADRCTMRVSTLMKKAGLKERRVQRALRQLEAMPEPLFEHLAPGTAMLKARVVKSWTFVAKRSGAPGAAPPTPATVTPHPAGASTSAPPPPAPAPLVWPARTVQAPATLLTDLSTTVPLAVVEAALPPVLPLETTHTEAIDLVSQFWRVQTGQIPCWECPGATEQAFRLLHDGFMRLPGPTQSTPFAVAWKRFLGSWPSPLSPPDPGRA